MGKNQKQLLDGILSGDKTIIHAFYKVNQPKIRFLVLNNSGTIQDAEDVFQDALVFVYEKFKSGFELQHANLETYFYGVCRNLWRNKLRKNIKTICCEVLPNETADDFTEIEDQDQKMVYYKHLVNLNCKCQRILNLFFEGKSMHEIASLTNHSEGYVRKKKCDCKNDLIRNIAKDPVYLELREDLGYNKHRKIAG